MNRRRPMSKRLNGEDAERVALAAKDIPAE